jgi:hypothetical protein
MLQSATACIEFREEFRAFFAAVSQLLESSIHARKKLFSLPLSTAAYPFNCSLRVFIGSKYRNEVRCPLKRTRDTFCVASQSFQSALDRFLGLSQA